MSEQLLLNEVNQKLKDTINSEEKVDLLIKKSRLHINLNETNMALNTLLEAFWISPQRKDVRSSLNNLNRYFQEIKVFPIDYIKAILLDNVIKSNDQDIFNYFGGPNQDLRIENFINNGGIYELMEGFSKSLYNLHFHLVGHLVFMLCSKSDVASKAMITYISTNMFDSSFLSKVPDDVIKAMFLVFSKKNLWTSIKIWKLSLQNFFNDIGDEIIKKTKKQRQIMLLENILNIFSLEDSIFQFFCDSYSLYHMLSLFNLRNDKEIRALCSLIISKLIKKKDIEESLKNVILNFIVECLKKNTNEKLIEIYSIFIHLFTLDSSFSASLFLKSGFLEEICTDIQNDEEVNIFLLQMISSSCINIDCCKKLLEIFIPALTELRARNNIKVSSLSEIIVMKLTYQTGIKDNINNISKENILNLAKNLVSIISQDSINTDVSFIEGLTYVSMFSYIKEYLVSKKEIFEIFFKRIKEKPNDLDFIFPAFICIKNIVSYKPKLTEEQKLMLELKTILQESLKNHEDNLESDEEVSKRCLKIINYQILEIFNSVLSCKSDRIKTLCSKIILSLTKESKHRILLAKQGVIRILYNIIKESQTKTLTVDDSENNFQYPAIISLTRMLITVNPNLIFDRSRFQVNDIIIYIYECLKISDDNLLIQFECLLALTNLTSMNVEIREKFISIFWPSIELLWLSDNQLIQRSTVELLCNLVACPSGVTIFKKKEQRIDILLALADSHDKMTRCAAGGILATLSDDLSICESILKKKKGIETIINMMNEETDDLIHRGLVCMTNIIYLIDFKGRPIFKESNITKSLSEVIKRTKDKEIIDLSHQATRKLQEKLKNISE
ncbi:hypothetical protein PORY_001263 [Pneumocystis oryctolagi]|uniref:Uncharacterized protein n=1 Tax=Pneumocystis oryctolagi TaxID=42067 RepID=A0ACB7CDS0_9ASCO|nr:hypothetical protein PORY_001263 [Pneumocystis oryctolagi]